MKQLAFTLVFFLVVVCSQNLLSAPPPPPSVRPPCWPPPCIPIDGGISLLIAAGAIYGGRKLYKNNQEKNAL